VNQPEQPAALTIGGSDSAGCAGIQLDLRVFSWLGVFGTSAVTAVTAQTPERVVAIEHVTPGLIRSQIEAAISGLPVKAAKTGMLGSLATVQAVAATAESGFPPSLVVDPVLRSTSGAVLLEPEAVETLLHALLPRATLCTPNLDEAAVLLGTEPESTPDGMARAAGELAGRAGCSILVTGGHLEGDPVDLLWHEGTVRRFAHRRATGLAARGTGCMLSAAITAHLAMGADLVSACERGVQLVDHALHQPRSLEGGLRLPGI
jgi:hydroxymethylpyrimidine/phosphomethylpyrimidine kinase